MNKSLKYGAIALIAIGSATIAYFNQQPKRNKDLADSTSEKIEISQTERRKQALNINAKIIKPHLLVDEFSTTGVLLADEMVDLSFESSGKIVEINFEEGTYVKKGELLARINDTQLRAERERLTAQLKLATDRVYRQRTLLEKDAVSREALEQVQTDLATLQADIDIIDAKIAFTELRAPFDGVIGLRQVSLGQFANPTTIVAKLTKNSPLKVEFAIPERYARYIGKGANLTFSVEGELDSFHAQVYAAESTIDPLLHQYTLRAIYPNKDNRLMAGRYALVELKKDEISDAISVPAVAIVPEMGRDKVFLYRSGKATPVEITAGIRTEGVVQVLRGLNVNDTLIVSGTLQLRTGMDVVLDNIE